MTDETHKLSEAEEFSALLPWYASGKISAADKARVEDYVHRHPEAAFELELAREEADAVFTANQQVMPKRMSFDTLQAQVGKTASARMGSFKTGFLDRIGTLIAGLTPRQLALAGMAAALALLLQTATIGALINAVPGPGGGGYETASGPSDASAKGTYALVSFQAAAPAGTVSAFLAESGYSLVEGPKAGGIYRLRLGPAVLTDAARDAVIEKLKARTDLISFASAAPAAK